MAATLRRSLGYLRDVDDAPRSRLESVLDVLGHKLAAHPVVGGVRSARRS